MAPEDLNLSQLNKFYQRQFELQRQLKNGDDAFRKSLIQNCLNETLMNDEPIFFPDLSKDLEWLNTPKPLSLSQDFANKILIIDFFTYCCINCLHILPTLKQLENQLNDCKKVSIIGVHSAKFENEKITSQVKKAAARYSIDHPIVCDSDLKIWNLLNISCWPTILILSPNLRLLFQLVGEFTINSWLIIYCQVIFNYYYPTLFSSWTCLPLPKSECNSSYFKTDLKYPGKVEISPNGKLIAISDSGNNRIVITSLIGKVHYVIGLDSNDKFAGNISFNNPQGLAWLTNEILFVADTGNNCLKKIDLINLKVEVKLKDDNQTFKLSSPWDLCLVDDDKLFIAVAGSHQIVAFCLSNDCRIFNNICSENTSILVAGNGKEENRNNFYPLKAGFAQPSGLAYSPDHEALFIADSESSSIRKIDLKTGAVKNLIGANINPGDLFDFGDKDGTGLEVKLEHPLGVAYNHHTRNLWIADTYNHKIKLVAIEERKCFTVLGKKLLKDDFYFDEKLTQFNEPSDISVHPYYRFLLIVDTNNHCIKKFDLETNTISKLKLNFNKHFKLNNSLNISCDINTKNLMTIDIQTISLFNIVKINLNFELEDRLSFNSNGPNLVEIQMPEKCHLESSKQKYSIDSLDNYFTFTLVPFCDEVEKLKSVCKLTFSIKILNTVSVCSYEKGLCWTVENQLIIPFEVDDQNLDSNQKLVNIDCVLFNKCLS